MRLNRIFPTARALIGAGLLAGLFAGLSAPALAEGWSWTRLSDRDSIEACKSDARESFNTYAGAHSRRDDGESSRAIYAYDLGRDGVDSVVWCISRPGGQIDAILITHNRDGLDNPRRNVHALLRAMMRDLDD